MISQVSSRVKLNPFHLAIPVKDLIEARHFYGNLLGCSEGRSSEHWVDFNFFGHQLVCHLDPQLEGTIQVTNQVDGHGVPIPHFGIVLEIEAWQELADRMRAAQINFIIEPHIRFKDQPGEQATMFFLDPSGNALEFKGFKSLSDELFKT